MQVEKTHPSLREYKFPTLVDLFRPKTYITLGQKGSGKSEINEKNGCDLHEAGWLGLDLWGVMGESFFWAINFDHEKDHQLRVSMDPNLKGQKHCGCRKAYPIQVLAPSSIKFDQNSIDKFNGYAVKSKTDWMEYCEKFRIYPVEWNDKMIGQRLKENNFKNKSLFKVTYLPEPTQNGSNHERFIEEFTSALLQAKSEDRICVFNPQIWLNEASRFRSVDLIIRSLEQIKYDKFVPTTQDVKIEIESKFSERGYITHDEWRKYNASNLFLLIRELGELAASQLKAFQSSTMSKRGILAYIRRARHNGITSLWDLQNPEDCFSSIRNQADCFFIKRANPRLLGQEWTWLYKEVESKRKWIKVKNNYNQGSEREADKNFKKIEDLDVNQLYFIEDNGNWKLRRISTPYFHHKQQEEHFGQLTGITWEDISSKSIKKTDIDSIDTGSRQVRDSGTMIYVQLIGSMIQKPPLGKGMTQKEAFNEIMKMAEDGKITRPSWSNFDSMSKWYKRNSNIS